MNDRLQDFRRQLRAGRTKKSGEPSSSRGSVEPAAPRTGHRGGRGHQDLADCGVGAPVHATLAQPAAGADSLKDFRARRAEFF